MAENKNNSNNNKKKPRFNLSWFYIVIAVALGWLFFNSNGEGGGGASKQATYSEFKQYVERGYASRIVVYKDQGPLNMYVRAEHIRDVFKNGTGDRSGEEPYVIVKFGSIDKLEEFLDEQQHDQQQHK